MSKSTFQLPIFYENFDLIKQGLKTIEIRVGYAWLIGVKKGDTIKFVSKKERLVVLVQRVSRYSSFEKMLTNEDSKKINPYLSSNDQLSYIRGIYSPTKEALGVLAIEFAKQDAEVLRG